mgnify:CR=1 FL=1
MIQPVRKGAELIAEIEAAAGERPVLWWLGQSGFAVKHAGAVFYLDPYLSESLTKKYQNTDKPHVRMTQCPLAPEEIRHADLILCTHKHSDHLDPGTVPAMLAASPRARVVLPKSLAAHAEAMGIARERMIPSDAGQTIRFSPRAAVHVIPSAHEKLDWTEETGYPCLGYVLEFDGAAIYHPGDCVPYDGLLERLAPYRPGVALLPVNGRDPARGVPGNFTMAEAAQLAENMGAKWVIPTHYDMFTFNTADVREFLAYARRRHPALGVVALRCGERWEVPPG